MLQLEPGLLVTVILAAMGVATWEWKKIMTLKREVESLRSDVTRMHLEHQELDNRLYIEQNVVLKDLAGAIDRMNGSIDQLTHYIRWLGQVTQGQVPPPPLDKARPI